MNEKEFLQKIKEIKVNVPDEQFFLEYNAVVYNILEENQQLKEAQNELKEKLRFRINKCQRLEKENRKYKDIIDRAIDYLENTTIVADSYYHQRACLLNILKRGCSK